MKAPELTDLEQKALARLGAAEGAVITGNNLARLAMIPLKAMGLAVEESPDHWCLANDRAPRLR